MRSSSDAGYERPGGKSVKVSVTLPGHKRLQNHHQEGVNFIFIWDFVASTVMDNLDELYIWLSNPTAVEYIRNTLKRVRKKESSLIMASQNLEDFDVPGVREMTRPLFAIPTHQFLFNAGNVDKRFYMDNLQLEASEFELIAHPQNGVCLFKCGNERYLLEVHAPDHIRALFGEAGGR